MWLALVLAKTGENGHYADRILEPRTFLSPAMIRQRPRTILLVITISLLLPPLPALLAAPTDCAEAVSTAEMRSCANAHYQEADAELNRVYRQLVAGLSEKGRTQLKAAQQAWLVFRDKNAAFAATAVDDGALAPVVETTELTTLTRQRIEQLKRYRKEQGN